MTVEEFCKVNNLQDKLKEAIDLAKELFPLAKSIVTYVEHDPEIENESNICLLVETPGIVKELVSQHRQFSSRWVAMSNSEERYKIRLSLDIMEN